MVKNETPISDGITETMTRLKNLLTQIEDAALDGLCTDGAHHKQYYLELILELTAGEKEVSKLQKKYDWEDGIAP